MSQFAQALRSFRSGVWSKDQLLSEVDRQLTERRTAPGTLLAILDNEHTASALPLEVHSAVSQRISRWLQDHTMLRQTPDGAGADADSPKTVLLDLPPNPDGTPNVADSSRNRVPQAAVGGILQGRFKLIELVGEGGMSRVYKAIDLRRVEARSQDPYLAVKILTVPFSDYFGSIAALHREAHKLQSLTHPNIVRVIDCDRDGQTVFMTMEFLAGQPLHRRLQKQGFKNMTPAEAVRIVESIAAALEFAHRTRIVHGDLKPGNVIITDSGEVKVIDFGIARFLARPKDAAGGEPGEAWEALNALTPPYASPEMLEDKEPDPRDDVYALACIAYEVLTGEHPYGREAAVAARDAGMKLQRRPGMNGTQFRAIAHGLQFERSKRTPTAQRFMEEFTGKRAAARWRVATVAAGAVFAVATAVYFNRTQQVTVSPEAAKAAPLSAGTVFRDCPTCPLMRVLPPGHFTQGSPAQPFEQPVHEVAIGYPLAAALHEVTIGEFEDFADDSAREMTGCATYDGTWQQRADVSWDNVDDTYTALHPVSCVSWQDATAYAQWLSQKTGQSYRLPSASEWEYAARAGAEAPAAAPSPDTACSVANVADETAARRYPGWEVLACRDDYVHAAPVGSFAANPFGLHDMLGNVFEWVEDCWHDDYENAPSDGSARVDGDCAQREMRGGSWFTAPSYIYPAYRNQFASDYRSASVGFRVVREIRP